MRTTFFYIFILFFGIMACSDGKDGLDGIDGAPGEQGPQGPQGIEGNANVTLYKFAGVDFTAVSQAELFFPGVDEEAFYESGWYAYLVFEVDTGTEIVDLLYQIPGYGRQNLSFYQAVWYYYELQSTLVVQRVVGAGEIYKGIHVIQVHANNVEEMGRSTNPDLLDYSNYHTVLDYYGLQN